MGEVYEAEDRELREHIALKTIRPEIAADERALDRFRREVRVARQVTHPNVCRIYDVFRQETRTARGSRDVVFVTMELLRGETLAERLRRTGRFSPDDALPLVRQMAMALAAAHDAGVVHRDFKSSNVMLLPPRSDQGTTRVVVTDFGLARRSASEDASLTSASAAGQVWGTPAYMAPEQIEGREITGAVDIYALGVVMFEMITGAHPFVGDTPISTAIKRLHQPPVSPRSLVPDLDKGWETTILRALERSPSDRFQAATEIVDTLSGAFVAPSGRERRYRQRRTAAAALSAALLVVLAGGGVWWWTPGTGDSGSGTRDLGLGTRSDPGSRVPDPGDVAPRRAVAVLGFRNLAGRPDVEWLSTALSEMLISELAAGDRLRIVPGENVARMKIDLELGDADSFARDTLSRIRANIGSDLVVLGSYAVIGDRLRLDLRLQDAVNGNLVAAVTESAGATDVFDLISRAGARVREQLGVQGLSPLEAQTVRAALPSSPEAARLYAEGLARLRRFEAQRAREILEQAVAADPQQPLAHIALASAWQALGYDARAAESARRAFELSGRLSRDARLWIEGQYREANNERDLAVDIYRTLFDFFHDDVEYGLRLASAQTAAGRAKEALATVDVLRRLPPPAAEDPGIDLAEASAAAALSDNERQRAAAARAAGKARAVSSRLVLARALTLECGALGSLGNMADGVARCEEARRLFAEAGDGGGAARATSDAAVLLRQQGKTADALRLYDQALATYRKIGDRSGVATALNNVANIVRQQADMAGALKRYEESLAIYREIGDKSGTARVLNNIAIVHRQQGRLPVALTMYREALALRTEIGEKEGVAATQSNIGNVLTEQGNLEEARKVQEDALATMRGIGEKRGVALGLNNLAFVASQLGDVAAAQQAYEESLAVSREVGDKRGVARALTNLADVRASQGDLAGARSMYEEAVPIFRDIGEQRGLGYAESGLGRVSLAQGRFADVRTHHDAALAIRKQIGDPGTMAESRVFLAELAIEEGRAGEGETLARSAAEHFTKERLVDQAATAYAVVARARLAQKNIAGAREAADRATALTATLQNRYVRLATSVDVARAHAAAGRVAEAVKILEATLMEASDRGLVETQLAAGVALGEIEIRAGRSAAGRSRLAAVEKQAASRGFTLIARRAAAGAP
jgi:tetratricopeptide (TPR) repeat protein